MSTLTVKPLFSLGESVMLEKHESVRGHAKLSHIYGVIVAIDVHYTIHKNEQLNTPTYVVLDNAGSMHVGIKHNHISRVETFIAKQKTLMLNMAKERQIYMNPEEVEEVVLEEIEKVVPEITSVKRERKMGGVWVE